MSDPAARFEQEAEEFEQKAARRRRMAELARELGDDGIAEFIALVTTNGNGHADSRASKPDAPRGRDAVREIVKKRPGIWTLAELRAEMIEREWFTSPKGLEAAAKRLCDVNGEGRRIGRGRFLFPANHGEEGAGESEPSGGAMIPTFTVE